MSNLAENINIQEEHNAEILHFPGMKMKKDGTVKNTPNNNSINRWCDPIRDREDIGRVSKYLLEKINAAKRKDTILSAYRNKLLFTIGIHIGVRVSDLVALKWNVFLQKDMKTFNDECNIREKKTKKLRKITANDCVVEGIEEYLEAIHKFEIYPKCDDYIFLNSRTGEVISDATVERLVKDFSKECNLVGRYNTHSLRKTYAYQKYMLAIENNVPEQIAIAQIQKEFNHSNSYITLSYLGISKEERIQSSMNLGNYLKDYMAFE